MKRKKELVIVLTSLLVIVLSVSVAYFTTKILGTGKEISVESADLKVIFTSGSGTINGSNIEPGWSSGENTFTVKNESNGTYNYNIVIKDLVNTFVTEGFLQYKITSTDGGYNMTDFADVPKSKTSKDVVLAYNVSVDKDATHTYTVEFKYLQSTDVDQSADMGKTLTGKIFITEGTERPTLASQLLLDNPTISTRTDFSTVFTTTNTGTLYKATENIAGSTAKDVYYFAGDAKNNWVKFAGFYWRIIRTNADGSVRLLYSGTSPDTTEGYIGKSAFNTNYKSPKYVGYMYGDSDTTLEEARTNTNDSTIKTYIDNWYENNLTSYTNYLSNDAVYCNDRELASGNEYSTSSKFNFKSYERLYTSKTPTYDCTNTKDAFSVNNTEAKLKYPIALMTADEINIAGGLAFNNAPAWYYLNSAGGSITGSASWYSLSPEGWSGSSAQFWYVLGSNLSGQLSNCNVRQSYHARPVVSLKACTLWSQGDGSALNPYEIVENGGC